MQSTASTTNTTETTTQTGSVRPLPDDPIQRLQARTNAARLQADALDAQEDTLRAELEVLEDQSVGAWAVVHAYEHIQNLPLTVPIDNDATLTDFQAQGVWWLLANVTWTPTGTTRWAREATASLESWHPGTSLRFQRNRLETVTGCPADPDHHHVAAVDSRVQLDWVMDNVHRPDHPRWACDGPCATSTATDLDPNPDANDDGHEDSEDGELDATVGAVGTAFNGEVWEVVDQAHGEAGTDQP